MRTESAPRISFADRVALATGLAGTLAVGAVQRCCERAGVDVHHMMPDDLVKLLPHLQAVLLLYLPAEQSRIAMSRLRQLLP